MQDHLQSVWQRILFEFDFGQIGSRRTGLGSGTRTRCGADNKRKRSSQDPGLERWGRKHSVGLYMQIARPGSATVGAGIESGQSS